jgi:1-acyl-sn-glycerol-3-phosphate acyltransferase
MASKVRRSAPRGTARARAGDRAEAGDRTDAEPRPARTRARRRPALGNDPFTRGAAPRSPALAAVPTPPPSPTPAPGSTPPSAPALPSRVQTAAARLDEVERKVETALGSVESRLEELVARSGAAQARDELREAIVRLLPRIKGALSTVGELLLLAEPPERLDRYGMDPRFAERAQPLVELLYSTWWRTDVRLPEKVPADGPVVVVANHAGVVPWDALVLRHALRREHPARRDLRPLLDDRECALPVFGPAAVRLGAVRATPESADRILKDGGALGVFPEGSAGARKPWRERYRLVHFGRGGFVKVALRAGAAIVPCAIVGSEEASPAISRSGWLADLVGVPVLSSSPALRFLPAALVPLPSRWSLRFGDPVDLSGLGPADADDPAAVNDVAGRVRETLQAMIDEDLAARRSVYL